MRLLQMRLTTKYLVRCVIFAIFSFMAHCTLLSAQDADPPTQKPADAYTLHVYANRIQLPTVVIDGSGHQVHSLTRDNFDITLDGGAVFHPTAARRAGDDPITLALLLDVSGNEKDVYKQLPELFAALVPDSLHPKDHILVFAVDCNVIRSLNDVAADPVAIKLGIERAFTASGLHGKLSEPACATAVHLWDAIASAANALSTKPGRRVILVLSPGSDYGSKYSLQQVADFAGANGVAIFGMRDRNEFLMNSEQRVLDKSGTINSSIYTGGRGVVTTIHASTKPEDTFEEICRKNGGVAFNIESTHLATHLQEFVALLRDRYIIEYPRPDEARAGKHTILVSVHTSNDLVLPTGASTPLPDPNLAADPTTVPSSPSQATFGGRKRPDPKPKN